MDELKKISEEHKELYHYTTAAGMQGILQSQQLWATHMGYLNDAEEHIGFFKRRLPKLLEAPVKEAVNELNATDIGRKAVEAVGGPESAISAFKDQLLDVARRVALDINDPYVVSFCSGNKHLTAHDGLLSQWRAYGPDGGYAIVFDAAAFEPLLETGMATAHNYQHGNFCDMDYDFPEGTKHKPHPERDKWESDVQGIFKKFILTRGESGLSDLYPTITSLSVRYKHHGFSEEAEVRMVAIPIHDEVHKIVVARSKGEALKPRIPIKYRERHGIVLPYIELFGRKLNGPTGNLPIVRILVGPHVDRVRRVSATLALAKSCGLNVPVVASDIPYRGR